MRAIVYMSRETQPFTSQELQDLLEFAVSKNRENGITGCLHYESGYFLQCIEGETDALHDTIDRISRDSRHKIFYRAEDENLLERRFPNWHMWWEARGKPDDLGSAISDLGRTLQPFERLHPSEELERAFTIYKQIAYDHVLRNLRALKSENNELAGMLSMAVHDLRSPVNTISGLVEMYVADAGDQIDPEFLEIAEFIKVSLSRMNGLVDGILEHFDTDAKLATELVDTGTLVDDIASGLRANDTRNIIVRKGDFPKVEANALRMWRVLNCLVTNGLKYNPSATPSVEVSVEQKDSCWQFCVRDDGIGIDPKHHQKIFEMFQRLHAHSTYPGTGVGLATCRKLVEQWNGKIWVSSQQGEGSKFCFTYPMHQHPT